jgi:hypothetical protein
MISSDEGDIIIMWIKWVGFGAIAAAFIIGGLIGFFLNR